MKTKNLFLTVLVAVVFVMGFSSCDKLDPKYQVRVQNDIEVTTFGVPTYWCDVVSLKCGDVTFNDIELGDYSDYMEIGVGEFDIEVTVKEYTSNGYYGTNTYELGSETWATNEEHTTFKIKLTSWLLQPSMEVFYEEE